MISVICSSGSAEPLSPYHSYSSCSKVLIVHIGLLVRSPIIMTIIIDSTAAERILDRILSTYDGKILAVSIIDTKGNILCSKSTESFSKEFRKFKEGPKYGGTLAIASLSIANEVRAIAGEAKAITTTYERCKMMLIPIPAYEILVGFVLQRRVVLDEERIANYIEGLIAENNAASTDDDDDDTSGNAANNTTTRDATT